MRRITAQREIQNQQKRLPPSCAPKLEVTSLTWQHRAGETRYIDPVTEQERSSRLWLRQIGGHNAWRDSNGQLRTTSHRYVSQLGADLLTGGFTDSDSWRLGVMAGYARDYNSTHSSVSDYRSKGSVRGYSAGLYATWFADDISKKLGERG